MHREPTAGAVGIAPPRPPGRGEYWDTPPGMSGCNEGTPPRGALLGDTPLRMGDAIRTLFVKGRYKGHPPTPRFGGAIRTPHGVRVPPHGRQCILGAVGAHTSPFCIYWCPQHVRCSRGPPQNVYPPFRCTWDAVRIVGGPPPACGVQNETPLGPPSSKLGALP